MPSPNGIRVLWHDGIGPTLELLVLHTADKVLDEMESGAEEMQIYAQSNAPWQDITGDARDGLFAEVGEEGGEIVLTLGHSVDYGEWLETIQAGAYAIILPTLEALGPEILERAGAKAIEVDASESLL